MTFEFYVMAYINNSSINKTSSLITISVEPANDNPINMPPFFTMGDPPIQEIEIFENETITVMLPEIYDEKGSETVHIEIIGMKETIMSFDHELREFHFFNLSESANITTSIKLTDLDG